MTTIVASTSGGTRAWSDSATWVGGVVPSAADDVQLTSSSGTVTIAAGAACRSLDCTGYTSTLTHNTSATLTIGDATAGVSSIALKLVSSMTYTLGSSSTSAIVFASTSATVQTIDTGGKTLANWTINGAGSSYRLDSGVTTGTAAGLTLASGTLDVNGQTCSWGSFGSSITNTRSLLLGSASITITGTNGWSCATATNMTLSAGTSTITFSAAAPFVNLGINLSYYNLVFNGSGTHTLTSSGGVGTGTIANLTRTGTATKTDGFVLGTSFTITGTLTLNGNSVTNRLFVQSANIGNTGNVVTVAGSVVGSNVDISGINGAGASSWNLSAITGGAGDGGGNSNITFTSSVTQTWSGTSGGNWSANAWTSRVPLPQDDVVINAAFSASQTVTMDMPRLGRSIDWTGATGAPAWAVTSTPSEIFGSLNLVSGMTISGTGSALVFRGRSSYNITSNGVAFPAGVTVNAGSSTYTLQDALTLSTGILTIGSGSNKGGTLNTNGQTITCPTIVVGNGSGASVLTLGASTINLTSTTTGAIFTATVATGTAINAGTSNIVIANASSNDRNIVAQGFTLATVTYTVAGSTGRLIFGISGSTGTVTVGTLNFSDATNARGLRLWVGITLAITVAFNVLGSSGKLVTIDTSTGGTRATLSKASGVVDVDYLSLIDSAAAGGASWYAGANSTDAGNNTGWIFTSPPPVVNGGSFFFTFI